MENNFLQKAARMYGFEKIRIVCRFPVVHTAQFWVEAKHSMTRKLQRGRLKTDTLNVFGYV